MMKKNLLMIPLFLLLTTAAKSQADSMALKKWEIGIGYNSVEAQLNQFVIDGWGEYAFNNLTAFFGDQKNHSYSISAVVSRTKGKCNLRFEVGFTQFSLSSYYNGVNDSNATGVQTNLVKTDIIKQKMFWISPGLSWHIIRTDRVSFYSGINVNAVYYAESTWQDYISSNNSPDYDRWDGKSPGGFAIGPGTFFGIGIHLLHGISLSTEFSTSLVYYNVGGTQTGTRIAGPNLSGYPRSWSINDNNTTGFQFTKIRPSVMFTYRF